MAFKDLLIICLQCCIFQMAFSQYAPGYGPSQLGIPGPGKILPGGIGPNVGPSPQAGPSGPGYGNNYGAYGYSPYGGSGNGDVAVAGELPVVGTTLVAGQVPVIGGVQFGGSLPATGVVTITGTCSCGSPYGY